MASAYVGFANITLRRNSVLCDFVKAGDMLSDGVLYMPDILKIKGIDYFCNYMLQSLQEIYRSQGIKIADKHFEVIFRQMLQKVEIASAGDTHLIPEQVISKHVFRKANANIRNKRIILEPGDTQFKKSEIVSSVQLEAENKAIKASGFKEATARIAKPATAQCKVQGITEAATSSNSFLAAISFQETGKILVRSAIAGKIDKLRGIKENILLARLAPVGSGMKTYQDLRVTSKEVERALLNEATH